MPKQSNAIVLVIGHNWCEEWLRQKEQLSTEQSCQFHRTVVLFESKSVRVWDSPGCIYNSILLVFARIFSVAMIIRTATVAFIFHITLPVKNHCSPYNKTLNCPPYGSKLCPLRGTSRICVP